MAIEFTCPACAGTLRIRDEAVGRLVRCGGCLTALRVPEGAPTVEPDPAPAFPGAEPTPFPRRPPAPPPPPAPAPAPAGLPAFDAPPGEEAPVRGRSFWVLVTLGSVALGAVACCGLAAVVLPGPEWREFRSERGGYKVELPAAPKTANDLRRRVRGLQNPNNLEGTLLWTRAENYIIVFADLRGANRNQPVHRILNDAVRDVTGGQNVRTEAVVVSGCPAREFEFRQRNGGTYTGRVVLAGDRVFVLFAGGRFTRPDNQNVRRFLDSFEVTDPKLLQAAKDRAAGMKNAPGPKVGD
jgi:hypothetical protein